jgi:hypothetical protein
MRIGSVAMDGPETARVGSSGWAQGQEGNADESAAASRRVKV